ncbi:TPA: SfnB family sulfur acquisition oxidoreductase [Klebsiella quasipneumoniae subsp. similipneumoniae]|uniref:SfnB family sulfur acquisition oxidoreductase n=1 Tax=Klebsiella quasipneumoniae TaxID=1463165 RepID=UPI00330BDE16|nr:SfnB family sulfur acquisition oxidoreductase [Klebsiella quasipneumoniae subsp. similipneumoniae]HDE1090911.1 SfnB family sulfur acquisition oxidoreductase [Klebsiella quasipneumoniae]
MMSASSPALPYTQSSPQAHIIASDAEALAIADEIAAVLKPGAAERDRTGIVPVEIVNTYSNSGLWGITVPRRFGGAEVSAATLAQVIAILSAADPSLGQIPQNHYCLLEDIRLQGSDDQQAFFFAQVLQGYRFANALSETGGKTVLDIRTRIVQGAEGLGITGRKGYCTGSLYAHWIGILALDADDRAQLAFVPQNSPGLTVVDDWACLGQRTTASGTVLAENLPVNPFHLFPTWKSYASPTLAGPFAQLTTAAIDAGIARAALEDTVAFVRNSARPWIDAGVARAGRVLDRYKNDLSEEHVAEASLAVARAKIWTTEVALEAASRLFELGGTRATGESLNLDRHWRNARVHTLHDPVRWKYQLLGNWVLNGIRPQRHDWN